MSERERVVEEERFSLEYEHGSTGDNSSRQVDAMRNSDAGLKVRSDPSAPTI